MTFKWIEIPLHNDTSVSSSTFMSIVIYLLLNSNDDTAVPSLPRGKYLSALSKYHLFHLKYCRNFVIRQPRIFRNI